MNRKASMNSRASHGGCVALYAMRLASKNFAARPPA
jgi:hypothetical protein